MTSDTLELAWTLADNAAKWAQAKSNGIPPDVEMFGARPVVSDPSHDPERGQASFRMKLSAPWLGHDREFVVTVTESPVPKR